MDRQITNLNMTNMARSTFAGTTGAGGASSSGGGGTINATNAAGATQHLSMTGAQLAFLKSKFQVGSCKSDKINFNHKEKVGGGCLLSVFQ